MHGPQRDALLHRRFIDIEAQKCVGCGRCVQTCPLGGVLVLDSCSCKALVATPFRCAGCGKCVERCPSRAIILVELPVYSRNHTDEK